MSPPPQRVLCLGTLPGVCWRPRVGHGGTVDGLRVLAVAEHSARDTPAAAAVHPAPASVARLHAPGQLVLAIRE